ncbi:ROK family protein [Streptomyces sp. NPDC049954]|uniref:ROK family protein n=1 Tax=Streptomyces sp. NPDC049954 TaxID=3155779 RepID=UPI003428936F
MLEIGGTHVTAALVDTGRAAVLQDSVRHAALDPGAPAEEILGAVLACAREVAAPPGATWGAAVPGPFDYARGVARFSGVGKFDALAGTDLGRALTAGLPGAGAHFRFLNDAHAFTLGEWAVGAGRGHGRVVGLTLGTGVGSAFLADGALADEGPGVPHEGHVHLLTIDGRPLEETVSRRALLRRYAAETGHSPDDGVDVRDLAERARAGEAVAGRVLHRAFHALGAALAPWLSAFGAEAVIVGGSVARAWDLVRPAVDAGITQAGPRTDIVLRRAERLVAAPLLGAALHVRQVGAAPRADVRRGGEDT